jgi:hypothetical protein
MNHFALLILVPLALLNATTAGKAETLKMSGGPTCALPQKESAMLVNDVITTEDATIPPIDRAAPDTFETAAFGLG